MIPALLIWAAAEAGGLPPIDGTLLPIGDECYSIAARGPGDASAGNILRRVERLDDKRLRITVISRVNGGPLLTSRMEVAFPSLRPIRTIEETDGVTSLSVRYSGKGARGTLTSVDGRRKTAKAPLAGPVWDEETMEFVLTTLPLAEGAQFEVPIFHFGRGSSTMRIHVRRAVAFGDGSFTAVAAWEVEGSTRSDMTITFFVAKASRRLLAIETGGVYSVHHGNCSNLIK